MVARKVTTNKPVLSCIRKHALYMAIAAAMSGTCLFSANASAAALVTTTGVQALMATETVTGKSQTTVASIGPLTNESSSEQQSGLESNIDSSSLAVVPVNASLGSTIYSSNQDAENAVSGYLKNYEQQIADAIVGSMKSSGTEVQLGMFTYIQNVQIANPSGGKPSKAQVYATVQVQPNGSYQFLGTNVNNNTLYLMYAIYQQSKDAAYLPAGWTVPYAGETRWELDQITEEGDVIQSAPVSINGSEWHTIQDNGAYDGAETVTNGVEKINYEPGVESLMQNQIKALMNQYNASLALVMYGEQVKVSRNSAGQPLTAISVNQRVYTQKDTPASCGQSASNGDATLQDSGQYGYLLTEIDDEYIVQPSGSYSDAGQNQENTISPTQNFTETKNLGSGVQPASYEEDVVFPMAPDAGDLVNFDSGTPLPESDYTYVAPMQQNITQNNANSGDDQKFSVGGNNFCINFSETQTYNHYVTTSRRSGRGYRDYTYNAPFSGPTIYINNQLANPGDFGSFTTDFGGGRGGHHNVVGSNIDLDGYMQALHVANISGEEVIYYGFNGQDVVCFAGGCGVQQWYAYHTYLDFGTGTY